MADEHEKDSEKANTERKVEDLPVPDEATAEGVRGGLLPYLEQDNTLKAIDNPTNPSKLSNPRNLSNPSNPG